MGQRSCNEQSLTDVESVIKKVIGMENGDLSKRLRIRDKCTLGLPRGHRYIVLVLPLNALLDLCFETSPNHPAGSMMTDIR